MRFPAAVGLPQVRSPCQTASNFGWGRGSIPLLVTRDPSALLPVPQHREPKRSTISDPELRHPSRKSGIGFEHGPFSGNHAFELRFAGSCIVPVAFRHPAKVYPMYRLASMGS
jgi:hypothetical protein